MTKAELNSVRELWGELQQLEAEKAHLYDLMFRLTPRYSDLPSGTPIESKIERLMVELMELERIMKAVLDMAVSSAIELSLAFRHTDLSPLQKELLFRRYIRCQNFDILASQMQISLAYCWKLHASAMKKLDVDESV